METCPYKEIVQIIDKQGVMRRMRRNRRIFKYRSYDYPAAVSFACLRRGQRTADLYCCCGHHSGRTETFLNFGEERVCC